MLPHGEGGLSLEGNAFVKGGIAPLAAEDRHGLFLRRRIALDQASEFQVIVSRGLGSALVITVGMHADAIELAEQAGFEHLLKKLPWELRRGGSHDGGASIGLAYGLASGLGQSDVLPHIGLGFPETDVGLIPDFPENPMPLEMPDRRRGPPGERRHAFGMLGRSGFLVEVVRVIEDEHGPQATLLQISEQLVVVGPVVLAPLTFGMGPTEIHPDELETGGGNQVQIAAMATGEVDVDTHALRQDWAREIRALRHTGYPHAATNQPVSSHAPRLYLSTLFRSTRSRCPEPVLRTI